MTVTSPAAALMGSRQFMLSWNAGTTIGGGADVTQFYTGHASAGIALGRPFRVVKLIFCGDVTAESVDSTLTVTVYKGSVAAGNRALEVTPALTAVAVVKSESETVVNSGKDVFTATEQLIVRAFYDFAADAATVAGPNVMLIGEWEI